MEYYKIVLERKCTATNKWLLVARFRYNVDAQPCAKLLSKLDQTSYRILDSRWPDEGDDITVYINGEIAS